MRIQHLSHATYQHQYHIVWGTKARRKFLKPYVATELKKSLAEVCKRYPTLWIEAVCSESSCRSRKPRALARGGGHCLVFAILSRMLYEFYGSECPHCQKMRKLTDKLMQEFPEIVVERKEVWHDKKNMELIKKLDKDDGCGGVPFFYNDKTKASLCGEVKYSEIKEWAGVK